MRDLEQLTNNTSVTAWVPADAYVDMILEAAVCHSQLSGVVTAVNHDLTACQGDIIQVRYVPARTAQGPIAACACLTDASSTLGTYSITVQQYGDSDKICNFSEFKACGNVTRAISKEMGKALSKKFDEEIWDALEEASAGCTETLAHAWAEGVATDACCINAIDLYNKIVQAKKCLQAKCVEPDYVIMHPTVAAHLYYKDASGVVYAQFPGVKYNGNGDLAMIAGLKVIETGNANTGTDASGTKLAIVIDSSRAVGEAWGKHPEFSSIFDNLCNTTRVAVWAYWGVHALDVNAIAHIVNP